MKRYLVLLLSLCLVLSMGMSYAAAEEKIHLTAWFETAFKGIDDPTAEGAEYGDFMRYVADLYMQQNPNVEIEVVVVSGQERSAKLAVAVQSNEMPDLMFDTHFSLMDYAHAGLLVPLNDIVTEDDRTDIPAAVWDNVTFGEDIFMFPFTSEDGHMAVFRGKGEHEDVFTKCDIVPHSSRNIRSIIFGYNVIERHQQPGMCVVHQGKMRIKHEIWHFVRLHSNCQLG